MIIFVGGQAFSVTRLNGREWGISLVLGLISVPIAVIIRLIPDEFIRKLIPHFWRRKSPRPQVFVSDEEQRYEWNPALEEIRDQLRFLKKIRGGRLNHLKYKLQHPQSLLPRSRSGSRSRESSVPPTPIVDNEQPETSNQPPTPENRSRHGSRSRSRSNSAFGPAAAMAGIIAGSIGGWSPVDRGHGEDDSIKFSMTGPHSGLDKQEGIEIHPGTRDDDPVINEYSVSDRTPPSQNPNLTPQFSHATAPSSSHSRGRSSSRHSGLSNNAEE